MTDKAEPPRTDDQQPIINIVGEKVALGPIRRDLTHLFQTWSNDFKVRRFEGLMLPISLESSEDLYSRISKDENQAYFVVYEKTQLRPIGNAGLAGIDHANRTAEFFIMIGDKESWGKGYGTEVTRLMLDYGFTCLGLHSVHLRVFATHERGIRAYRRAGFRMAGRWRQAKRRGDRAYDFVLMDCLATEFGDGALSHLLPETSEVED